MAEEAVKEKPAEKDAAVLVAKTKVRMITPGGLAVVLVCGLLYTVGLVWVLNTTRNEQPDKTGSTQGHQTKSATEDGGGPRNPEKLGGPVIRVEGFMQSVPEGEGALTARTLHLDITLHLGDGSGTKDLVQYKKNLVELDKEINDKARANLGAMVQDFILRELLKDKTVYEINRLDRQVWATRIKDFVNKMFTETFGYDESFVGKNKFKPEVWSVSFTKFMFTTR